MKVLIVNQHTANRGDESAGKALVRMLLKVDEISSISAMYLNYTKNKDVYFYDDLGIIRINALSYKVLEKNKYKWFILKATPYIAKIYNTAFKKIFWKSLKILFPKLYPFIHNDIIAIMQNDIIISAPSGPQIGALYEDCTSLWTIWMSICLKKKVVIYSPSIGEISKTPIYNKITQAVFEKIDFLSVRDAKSNNILNQLNIDHYSSIDTDFLEFSEYKLPKELIFLEEKPFVIFVPNELTKWPPNYKLYDLKIISEYYIAILDYFSEKKIRVVMLPQLYAGLDDKTYFKKIIKLSKINDVIVLDDSYNSDIQQTIISKSEFVIGARYHSIVFAINKTVPFFSLSYEHKMTGMLEKLGLDQFQIEVFPLFKDNKNINLMINKIDNTYKKRYELKIKVIEASKEAKKIALCTLNDMKKKVLRDLQE